MTHIITREVGQRRNNILGDNIAYVELVDWMGGDQQIVDRARKCYQSQGRSTSESDARLLQRLAGSKPLHGTTLRGTVFTFDVLMPQFVVRQSTRHIVGHDTLGFDVWHTGGDSFDIGGSFDEQSFRYTDNIVFYVPQYMHMESDITAWSIMCNSQKEHYETLRKMGFDKQLARSALGPQVYSQYEWSVNAQGVLDWYSKRLPGGGAQNETTKFAVAVMDIVREIIPGTVTAWEKLNHGTEGIQNENRTQ